MLRIRGGNIMRLNRKGQTLVEYVLIISLIITLSAQIYVNSSYSKYKD
mgnify:CR=1 FL=1